MRSMLRKLLPLTALGMSTLVGCADETPEIFIVENKPFTASCVPDTTRGQGSVSLGVGTFDVFVTNQYVLNARIESTLVPSQSVGYSGAGGGAGGLRGNQWEGNRISLRKAVVEYELPRGFARPLPKKVEIPLSGTIEPRGGMVAGVQAIGSAIGGAIAQSPLLQQPGASFTMKLKIKFYGETSSGSEVDSNEFVYPLNVCVGCLLQYPPQGPAACNAAAEGVEIEVPCAPGQDEPVDCRAVCPAITDPANDPFGFCSAF